MKNKFLSLSLIFLICLMIASCRKSDKQKIIGIWVNEKDWFDIKENGNYSTGTGPTVYYDKLNYSLDETKKELTFFTDSENKIFYMNYNFIKNDTIELKNKMPNAKAAIFYKTNKIPSSFF